MRDYFQFSRRKRAKPLTKYVSDHIQIQLSEIFVLSSVNFSQKTYYQILICITIVDFSNYIEMKQLNIFAKDVSIWKENPPRFLKVFVRPS